MRINDPQRNESWSDPGKNTKLQLNRDQDQTLKKNWIQIRPSIKLGSRSDPQETRIQTLKKRFRNSDPILKKTETDQTLKKTDPDPTLKNLSLMLGKKGKTPTPLP